MSPKVQSSLEERILLGASLGLVAVATALMWAAIRSRQRRTLVDLEERQQWLAKERVLTRQVLTAHEEERSHLARELHDDITQRLARLAIDAAQIEGGLPLQQPNGHPRSTIREELVRLSADVHRFAYRLHPSILDKLGLGEALRAECDHIAQSNSLGVEVTIGELPEALSREVSLCVFRVAQEALRNAVRHARARNVFVDLSTFDDGIQLSVRDDGVGIQPPKSSKKWVLGHTSMKERVSLLDGELDIESEPGNGTLVLAWLPLNKPVIT